MPGHPVHLYRITAKTKISQHMFLKIVVTCNGFHHVEVILINGISSGNHLFSVFYNLVFSKKTTHCIWIQKSMLKKTSYQSKYSQSDRTNKTNHAYYIQTMLCQGSSIRRFWFWNYCNFWEYSLY